MIFYTIARAINMAVDIVVLLIIVRAVLSFFPNMDERHPLVRTLDQITTPIIRPFQRLLPPMGGLDFSPILAILTLQVGGQILTMLLMSLGGR